MGITLEAIKAEHTKVAEMIAAFEEQALTAYIFPETEIKLKPGEHYAGIIIGKDGYWSCEQRAAYSYYAWYQRFGYGYQIDGHESSELRARAVRRHSTPTCRFTRSPTTSSMSSRTSPRTCPGISRHQSAGSSGMNAWKS